MAEEKKVENAPKIPKSRWQISSLPGNMMFIHDPSGKTGKDAAGNERPFGWVMSESEAAKKFIIKTNVVRKGGVNVTVPTSDYDEDDIELSNQVMGYLSSKNAPKTGAETVMQAVKPAAKPGRPATGRKNYNWAEYQKAYRERQKQKKIQQAQDAKKGI